MVQWWKNAKLEFLGFCAFGDWKKKIESLLRNWNWKVPWKATVKRNVTKNLDADYSGLCSFGADGFSTESAWILSLTGFALWLRPTRNGNENLIVQARNENKKLGRRFFRSKLLRSGWYFSGICIDLKSDRVCVVVATNEKRLREFGSSSSQRK
jgi:hypothetical protein